MLPPSPLPLGVTRLRQNSFSLRLFAAAAALLRGTSSDIQASNNRLRRTVRFGTKVIHRLAKTFELFLAVNAPTRPRGRRQRHLLEFSRRVRVRVGVASLLPSACWMQPAHWVTVQYSLCFSISVRAVGARSRGTPLL